LFGNEASVQHAHYSIGVPVNDGDDRGIAARDEDVARHAAEIRRDLRRLRARLIARNSGHEDDGSNR
jgi:hypothetical protein